MKRVLLSITAAVLAVVSADAQNPLRIVDRPFPADELVAPGDYDGDGDLDGLSYTRGLFDGRVLVNDGHARFTAVPATGLTTPATAGQANVLAADFNGDGLADVLVHSLAPAGAFSGFALTFGGPGFAFVAAPALPGPLPLPNGLPYGTSVAPIDFDADGDLDLAVAVVTSVGGASDGVPELWVNGGTGTFTRAPAATLTAAPAPSSRVVAHDLNADGSPDLVFLGAATSGPAVPCAAFLNGGGFFSPYPAYPSAVSTYLNFVNSVTHGDFNGDGLVDLAYALGTGAPSGAIEVRLGVPGGFAAPVFSNLPGATPPPGVTGGLSVRAYAVDTDGDGSDEFAYGAYGTNGSGPVVVDVLATGSAGAVNGPYPAAVHIGPPADFDQDGDPDFAASLWAFSLNVSSTLLTGGDVPAAPGLFLCDGLGGFAFVRAAGDPAGVFSETNRNAYVATADFNGDGTGDVFGVSIGAGGYFRVATSDGKGGFDYPAGLNFGVPFTNGSNPPQLTRGRAAADFDLDGDVDVLVRGLVGGSPADYLFLNLGGGFAPAVAVPVAGPLLCPACPGSANAVCDVDVDGDPDAIMAALHGFVASSTTLALNQGGFFSPAASLGPAHATRELLVGDFDGDGDDDLLQVGSARPTAVASVLWTSQPGGPIPSTLAGLSGEFGAVGDLNGDNVDDVVLDGTVFYFTNGAPTAGPLLVSALRAPGSLVDLDLDGDLDLVEAPGVVMLNQGGAVFGAPDAIRWRFNDLTATAFGSSQWVTTTDYRCFPADVDRDGDMDLIAPGPTVITNVTRHLAHDGAPRIGRPTGVKLYGAPGQAYALFASPNAVRFPFAPFGTLLIDPATAVPIAAGSFAPPGGPGAGEALVPFTVPNLPAYVGLTLHWQSLDFGSLRFTNRLTSVVLPD